MVNAPQIIEQLLPNHAGRGRGGLRPEIIVMHIQDGLGNPWGYFNGLPGAGPTAADCTIWNPRAEDGKLVRYLYDSDEAWTNGGWTEPINHANPVLEDLYRHDIYSGTVSLTVENEGTPAMGITDAQVERLAQLVAWWCVTFIIPPDRDHIVGHYEIGPHKYCPGQGFPFGRIIQRAQQLIGIRPAPQPQPVPVVDPTRPSPDRWIPRETGFEVNNSFGILRWYENHDGFARFGFPISGAYGTPDPDPAIGNKVVQEFEKGRIEFHLADSKMYLGNIGTDLHLAEDKYEALEEENARLEGEIKLKDAEIAAFKLGKLVGGNSIE